MSIHFKIFKLLSCVLDNVPDHVIMLLKHFLRVFQTLGVAVYHGHELAQQYLMLIVSLPQYLALPLSLLLDLHHPLSCSSPHLLNTDLSSGNQLPGLLSDGLSLEVSLLFDSVGIISSQSCLISALPSLSNQNGRLVTSTPIIVNTIDSIVDT